MTNITDDSTRDILIELRTDVKYIKGAVRANNKKINAHAKRIDVVEDWQEGFGIRMKFVVGVASFVGGVFVFIADKVIDFFTKRI